MAEEYWSASRQREKKYKGLLDSTDWDTSLQVKIYVKDVKGH